MEVKIPSKISFAISYKVNPQQILILGGTKLTVSGEKIDRTKQAYLFQFSGYPDVTRTQDLTHELLSIYPPFKFKDSEVIYLVNEDPNSEDPTVVKYSLKQTNSQ